MTERVDISPRVWGRPGWEFLDYIVDSYPITPSIQDKTWMINLLYVLGDAIPCARCRTNYKNFLKTYPPENNVDSPTAVRHWFSSYKIRNK